MKIYVERNLRRICAGEYHQSADAAGNPQFRADRIDGQTFTFYSAGAAELWLRLGGLLWRGA